MKFSSSSCNSRFSTRRIDQEINPSIECDQRIERSRLSQWCVEKFRSSPHFAKTEIDHLLRRWRFNLVLPSRFLSTLLLRITNERSLFPLRPLYRNPPSHFSCFAQHSRDPYDSRPRLSTPPIDPELGRWNLEPSSRSFSTASNSRDGIRREKDCCWILDGRLWDCFTTTSRREGSGRCAVFGRSLFVTITHRREGEQSWRRISVGRIGNFWIEWSRRGLGCTQWTSTR